ncbi:MAG: isoprenyl transferase [Desulfobacteraceae bacterium]|nr:isoprenyl transferase [Desulfobacteraceae bacterium]MCF8093815.1 isoprenyl transferase [Desulfobacteraceae bacterium]
MKSEAAENAGLNPSKLPSHVAVIMDGNGRWAKKRVLNRVKGHERGADTVRMVVRASREIGIRYLTLYAFSTENWQRPETEISALMTLLKRFLTSETRELAENNIRLNIIGEIERLPEDVQQVLEQTAEATRENDGMCLTLALSYGGRAEIAMAARAMAEAVKDGRIAPEDVGQENFAKYMYTSGMPDPELLIRTSGEFRVSNFLLWQIAYAEIFVTPTLWPDFTREEYYNILKNFQERERRFGRVPS